MPSSVLKSISVAINFENDQNEPDSVNEFRENMDLSVLESSRSQLESIRNLQANINKVITDKINSLKKLTSESADLDMEELEGESEIEEE